MNRFRDLLEDWDRNAAEAQDLVTVPVALHRSDLVKIKAFAEVYKLPESTVIADLLGASIKEAEAAMPYIQSGEVIRIEEGEPVYADAGRTPEFVSAEQKIAKQLTTGD
ncbi:hypothetical protein [Pseudomonas sp. MF4836]|uniref:hypothetical protein n=1 Tax=Pseudomonas sp. MF4836 TaxID=1960827 RepID=UPI00099859E0|nr:hypothetical protein [Pseudomonas sp. MF4836]OOV98479.1 hypothetical protein MF4836_09015 [Pseudomonas sp. MF4836]